MPKPHPTDPRAIAEYAALIAFTYDIHAPQYNLTDQQWQAAEQWLNDYKGPASIEEKVTFDAVATMVHDLPVLGWTADEEAVALRMIAAHEQAWAGASNLDADGAQVVGKP
ncbi:hypothetical protein [Micromonospora carbonacea]|uniref:hypothetical protein n=1 Tax=Micromonospora carbonacea TaxID=47853 RepID=UPI003720E209